MSLNDFRSVFMPFCIQKQNDGRYVVLNREYNPVGFFTQEFVNYEEHPVSVRFKGIDPSIAAKISWDGSENTDNMFLYNDGGIPTESEANMKTYLAKLQILAGLRIN